MGGKVADHAADALVDGIQPAVQGLQLPGIALHGFQQRAQIEGAANGKAGIHHGKARENRGRRIGHRQRNHIDIGFDERINHADDEHGEHRPRRRGQRADIAVQIQRPLGIIPIAHMEDRFHQEAGHIFQQRSGDRAHQRHQRHVPLHRHAGQQNTDRAEAVDRQNRSEQKAPVDEPALLHQIQKDLPAPAAEAV